MQIAIIVPDEQVDAIDGLVPEVYRSRAEAVRVAIDQLLRTHRRQVVDQQYLDALASSADPDADALPLRSGDSEPASWKDIPW